MKKKKVALDLLSFYIAATLNWWIFYERGTFHQYCMMYNESRRKKWRKKEEEETESFGAEAPFSLSPPSQAFDVSRSQFRDAIYPQSLLIAPPLSGVTYALVQKNTHMTRWLFYTDTLTHTQAAQIQAITQLHAVIT